MTSTGADRPASAETGRRERKKRQTRQAISDVATELFLARGFDAVTVAEVAKAADVAVQTVFNHFPTKEDLFFDEDSWWAGPAEAIRAAPAEMDAVTALEDHYLAVTRARLESGHLATWLRFSRTLEDSETLRARRRLVATRMEQLIAEALLERDEGMPRWKAELIGAQYAAAQKVLEAELARLLPDTADQAQLEAANARLADATAEVFGILRHGLSAPGSGPGPGQRIPGV
ncbi:TetR family transcriptional regulator [Kribbella amoyensis]|uniref:TetR family transcriptional regulator n=1 Tax=Kribbella amoyensis TaxID=996641 RepID=A0A561BTY0_9ACTN|nr:TetR/AcrR family transcriptional regulator [Kribbella amoyensis]TWD82262.1 TetR family transcriptional regulator [Kribbella amoyensis]